MYEPDTATGRPTPLARTADPQLILAVAEHAITDATPSEIELRNEYGRFRRILSRADALALDLDLFIGIGNRRRIRFLRSRTQQFTLNAGSHTTQRLKGEAEVNIAHPLVREHRTIR